LAELETQAAAFQREHEELLSSTATAQRERALREQAEKDLQETLRRVRDLTRELQDASESARRLPVNDGQSLMRALAQPMSEAVAHAADRMASGGALADDHQLLSLAAAFAQLASETTRELTPKPADADDSATVTDAPLAHDERATDSDQPADTMPAAVVEDVIEAVTPAAPAKGVEPDTDAAPERRPRPRRSQMLFSVRPYGGAGEVGGSAIVVQTRSGRMVLLDAGQRVKGEYGPESANAFHYGLPGVDSLDAIVISHAHIDHIGSLPVLHPIVKGPTGDPVPVFMSQPTSVLGQVMLRDSAKIQQARRFSLPELADSDFAEGTIRAAYEDSDINAVMEHVEVRNPREPFAVADGEITIKLLPVAHVLGSCAVHVTDNETGHTLLYSGDLGPLTDEQLTIPDFGGADSIDQADVVVMESTYGLLDEAEIEGRRKRQSGRERELTLFYDAARKAFDRGGHVLLPAFSLGRTQELVKVIGHARGTELPEGLIYLGGMGERILRIYDDYRRPGSQWVRPGEFPGTTPINKWLGDAGSFEAVVDEILSNDSSYIIASPAMLSGGWSRAFLSAMVGDPRHAIVFTGYVPRHGGGIRNLSQMYQGARLAGLGDEPLKIACAWEKPSLSAHAPARDLRQFAARMARGRTHVSFGMVHGVAERQRALASDVQANNDNVDAQPLDNGVPWEPKRA
jgi:Cft2 family RNA processing exonuclease